MKAVRNILLLACVCTLATAQELEETLSEIIVTSAIGSTSLGKTSTAVGIVSNRELSQSAYTNIIDAVAGEPGVSQVTTGSGISKPVIRGLGYNRIVVVNDGVRQEGQQWGDEHGIEIDAQTINSVEIIKGPASLMYGSDAMAGVLIFHDAPKLPLGQTTASLAAEYQTNNGLAAYSIDAAGHPEKLLWDVRWSQKVAHAYRNSHDDYVSNSGFAEQAASALIGANHSAGYSQLKLDFYHIKPGIVEDDENDSKAYSIEAPYQQVTHAKAVIDNSLSLGNDRLKVLVGYQQNVRKEFEDEDDGEVECGLDMRLHTLNYNLNWLSQRDELKLSAGVNGMAQRSINRGEEYLIPDYKLLDVGLFFTAAYELERLTLSAGLRYDRRALHGEGLVDDGDERFVDFRRAFDGVTGSAGVAYNVSKALTLRLNAARGFRTPNISELASNGVHEGTIRYEIGNVDLKSESSWQFDLGLDASLTWLYARAAVFVNSISNYIFSQRLSDDLAPIDIDGYPAYKFVSGDARLMGGEISVDIHPIESLHFDNGFAYVDAQLLHQSADAKYLPLTPAPRWTSTLRYVVPECCKVLSSSFVAVGVECDFAQNHYHAVNETETATPGYTLLNASIGTDVVVGEKKIGSVAIVANNLTDKAYQSHLSRLKYSDIYNMGRNVALKIKLQIPD